MSDGEVQVRSADLQEVLAAGGGMAGVGDGIDSIVVDVKDRIVIGTSRGNVRIVNRSLQEVAPARKLLHR